MKPTLLFTLFLAASPLLGAKPLTIYAYDSFCSNHGLYAATKGDFKGMETQCVSFPSAGEALNQVALEGKKTKADILVGVDSSLLARARKLNQFEKGSEKAIALTPSSLRFDSENRFFPF